MSLHAIRSSHVHIIHTGSLCKDKLSTRYKNRAPHAKREASVIFSVLISHTLEPHALPGKKWRWGELILLHWIVFLKDAQIFLNFSQDCVRSSLPLRPWAGQGIERSGCGRVHCRHPRAPQDPDANRWFQNLLLSFAWLRVFRHSWLGHPSSWPIWSASLWHRPNRVKFKKLSNSKKNDFCLVLTILYLSISTSPSMTLSSRTLPLLR